MTSDRYGGPYDPLRLSKAPDMPAEVYPGFAEYLERFGNYDRAMEEYAIAHNMMPSET